MGANLEEEGGSVWVREGSESGMFPGMKLEKEAVGPVQGLRENVEDLLLNLRNQTWTPILSRDRR